MLQVRIAIVNFESGPYLADLLDSIAAAAKVAGPGLELRVTVIDNDSSDSSWKSCQRAPIAVELRRLERNVGFGRAANLALDDATETWLIPMNADALVQEDFFAKLAELQAGVPSQVGILAPALRDSDGGSQPSIGRFPTLYTTLAQATRNRRERRYVSHAGHRRGEVDWATGACLIVRREAWRRLCGFDPGFFLYYEDVDLCRRAETLAIERRFEPRLVVTHRDPLAQRSTNPELLPIIRYSNLLYFHKHQPRIEFHALAALTRLWSFVAAPPALDRAARRRLRELPRRVARGLPSPEPL